MDTAEATDLVALENATECMRHAYLEAKYR